MTQKALEEYCKYLLDQRSNLELAVIQLRQEVADLKTPKEEPTDGGN